MTIEAELPNGTVLEFPDGTSQDIIQSKVKGILEEQGRQVSPVQPGSPVKTPSDRAVSPQSAEDAEAEGGTSIPEAIVDEAPQTIGGVATGAAGAAAGLGLAPTIGLVGLGGGAGEAYKQIGQHLSGSLDAPKTSTESAKRIGEAALTEAGFEAVGGLVAKGFGKILAPFRKTVHPETVEINEQFADKIKPVLVPAEATESRVLDLVNNVAEASILGGNKMADFKAGREKVFQDFADSLIDQFGERTDPTDLGNLFVTAIDQKQELHKEAAEVLFNNVEDMVGTKMVKEQVTKEVPTGVVDKAGNPLTRTVTSEVEVPKSRAMIPTKELKDFADKVNLKNVGLGSIESKSAGDDLIATIEELPDEIPFDSARELRSRLLNRINEFQPVNRKAPAIGKAKRAIGILDKNITTELKKIDSVDSAATDGQSPYEAWRTANRFYKNGQEKFNNTFLRRMIKLAEDTGTGAENIAPSIFKPKQVSKVRKVKRALGESSDEWRKMKGFFVEHLMQKSQNPDGDLVGKRLLNNISGKPNSFGEPLLREVLTPDQVKSLKGVGRALKMTQETQGEGAGRMLIQLTQAGAIGSIPMKGVTLPAATIVFGPVALSRMMLNPQAAKWLTEGIQTPAGSEKAAGLMSRLVAASERVRRSSSGEKQNGRQQIRGNNAEED